MLQRRLLASLRGGGSSLDQKIVVDAGVPKVVNHRRPEHLVPEPGTRLVRDQTAQVNVRVRGLQDVAGVDDVVISHPQPVASFLALRRLDVDTIFGGVAYRSVIVHVHGHQEAIEPPLRVHRTQIELVDQAGVRQHVLHQRRQRIRLHVKGVLERVPLPLRGCPTQQLPTPTRHRGDDDILRDVHAHRGSGSEGIREVRQLRTLIQLDAFGTRRHDECFGIARDVNIRTEISRKTLDDGRRRRRCSKC